MPRLFFSALLLLLPAARAAAAVIAVYHTSDVHGWYSARPAAWDKANKDRLIGGFPALAALLKKETTPYLLLDSGDMFQGTPEGIFSKGLASVELMNALGYSAAVPGNHEYDYGEDTLKTMASSATWALLGANIRDRETGLRPPYLKPFVMLDKAGLKIAVLGLAGAHTAETTRPDGVKHLLFGDEASEITFLMPEIKEASPHAVIALVHLGLDEGLSLKRVNLSTWTFASAPPGTLRVARAAPGVDLLLGGHNHVAMEDGYRDPVSGTWLGESGYGLSYVTRAELDIDETARRVRSVKMRVIPLWIDQVGQDPEILALTARFAAATDKAMGRLAGEAAGDLVFSKAWLDSPFGNLLCDLTREATGADIAVHNTKSIRYEIRKGPVRLRDIYQALPFDNNIIVTRLTGAQLKKLVADNIVAGLSYIQVSGFEFAFTPGPGGKAKKIELTRGGKPVRPGQVFTVATNDYLAFGGTGGAAFASGRDTVNTMQPVRDLLIKAFERGPVSPPPVGRILKK